MRLREVAAKLSQEQQKRIEELNVQLLDEIDFEDTAPYRESPDAWRTLIYEEICTNEKISQAKIDYRRIGEISEEKLFKRFIEEADKNGKCRIAGDGRLAIVAINTRAVLGCYFGKDVKERGLIELEPYLLREDSEKHIRIRECILCRSNFHLTVEKGAVAALVNISPDSLPDINAMERLLSECGGHRSEVVFYAPYLLISMMKKNMECMRYNWQANNNCILDRPFVAKNPHSENNA